MVTVNPGDVEYATAGSGAATVSSDCGVITSESITTAAGSIYTLTLTNVNIAATDPIAASVCLGTSTNGTPQIVDVKPAAGSVVIRVKNIDGTNAFNGNIKIAFGKL